MNYSVPSPSKYQSMAPLILPNDKPVVTKASKYIVNDIVAFQKGSRLVAHRIIYASTDRSYFITKGDNNLRSDGKIRPNEILGKVETIKRGVRTITLNHIYFSQSSVYLKELIRISKKFTQNRILFLILKGLPLHIHFERSAPKRLYLDTDLLIKRKDLAKVREIFKILGYKPTLSVLFKKVIKNPTQISYVLKTKPFPTVIDIHLEPAIGFTKARNLNSLLPNPTPFSRHLFKNVHKIKIENSSFPILATDTLIVYLLLHLFHHNFRGAYRMEFIDNLIRMQRVEWVEVESITQKFSLGNFVYPAATVLKNYYKTPIPESFIKNIEPGLLNKIALKAALRLISPFNSGGSGQERIIRFILLLFLSPLPISQKIKAPFVKNSIGYFLLAIKSFFFKDSKKF